MRFDDSANPGAVANRRPAGQTDSSLEPIGDCCSRRSVPAAVAAIARLTLKAIVVMAVSLLVLEARAIAGLDTDIPRANQAILSSGRWTPSAEETQKALAAIQTYLEKTTSTNELQKIEIKKILKHTKEYRVQFVGVERNGKKYVWCNFFRAPRKGEKDRDQDWKRWEFMAEDGGFWYWRIKYDPSTGKCDKFNSNGYA